MEPLKIDIAEAPALEKKRSIKLITQKIYVLEGSVTESSSIKELLHFQPFSLSIINCIYQGLMGTFNPN